MKVITSNTFYKERIDEMDRLYTCADLANRYGVPIGTVWYWVRKKKLPAMKIGKEYRFIESDVVAFEMSNKTINT